MPDGVVRTDGDSRTSLSEDRQRGHIYTIRFEPGSVLCNCFVLWNTCFS